MTTRIQENSVKGLFIIALYIFLLLQGLVAGAQSYRSMNETSYRGFVASFGTRAADISSSVEKIDQTRLLQAGGQIGLILGNSVVRSKIGLLGYYSSTGNTAGSTDLYESNALVNFYPLALITGKSLTVEPYITGGVDYDQYKFYGYYINREPGQTNYSQAEAPFLGKIKQFNATVGAGIEVRLKDDYDFIHLFSEIKYGKNLSSKSSNQIFGNTQINNQTQLIVGISFGARR